MPGRRDEAKGWRAPPGLLPATRGDGVTLASPPAPALARPVAFTLAVVLAAALVPVSASAHFHDSSLDLVATTHDVWVNESRVDGATGPAPASRFLAVEERFVLANAGADPYTGRVYALVPKTARDLRFGAAGSPLPASPGSGILHAFDLARANLSLQSGGRLALELAYRVENESFAKPILYETLALTLHARADEGRRATGSPIAPGETVGVYGPDALSPPEYVLTFQAAGEGGSGLPAWAVLVVLAAAAAGAVAAFRIVRARRRA